MERDLLHEMETHHHHAGDPEEDDVEAGDQHRGRIEALQLRRLVRPAERRERPQRRREPGVEHVLVARDLGRLAVMLVGFGLRLGFARARRTPCRPARTTPESDGPTTAGARCTRAGCFPSSRNRCSPSSSGRTWSCRRAPPRSPASPASWRSTYHWSVRNGSITTFERSPCGTTWVCGSIFSTRPFSSSRATICLRAAKRSTPSQLLASRRRSVDRPARQKRSSSANVILPSIGQAY